MATSKAKTETPPPKNAGPAAMSGPAREPPGDRDPERPPHKLVRLLVEHFWWFALPMFGAAFWFLVRALNPFDLSFIPAFWAVRLGAAALAVAAVMAVPYLLWRREFDRAREDLALQRDGHLGVKDARRRLRRYGSRLTGGQREQVEAAIARVEQALREERGLGPAVTELEEHLDTHLQFARKGPAREYAESIGVAVFIALLLRAFVVEAFKIPSGSMIPTLQVGDHIFVNKFLYGVRIPFMDKKIGDEIRPPRRGEVIVFVYPKEPDKDFIKRIVAVAGDTVDVKGNKVYVNGALLPDQPLSGPCEYEDYEEATGEWRRGQCDAYRERNGGIGYTIIHDAGSFGRGGGLLDFPVTVPPRSVFVMGDNRDNSHDSRYWGFVPYDKIKGKAWIVWWSSGKGSNVRLKRMFSPIHPN